MFPHFFQGVQSRYTNTTLPKQNILLFEHDYLRKSDSTPEKSAETKVKRGDNMNNTDSKSRKSRRKVNPARTPEGRENQLIGLAVDLAEQKLRDGTASSQIITLLLGLASSKSQLELEKMRSDLRVAEAKIESMQAQQKSSELYEKAIEAFKKYNGVEDDEEDYDD